MATPKTTISFTGTAIVLANQKTIGIVAPPTLDRPVSLLAEKIHTATSAFSTIHKNLNPHKRNSKVLEELKAGKALFKSECEDLRQILQGVYRHAVDFTSSCQRAPDDRSISAQRCQRSGKAILRDMQEANRNYELALDNLNSKRQTLTAVRSADLQKFAKNDVNLSNIATSKGQPGDTVSILYQALDDVQLCLNDLFTFWDNHVSLLTRVLNRQSNFPVPGQETKLTVEMWTQYQKILLQSSSSISESTDALSVVPLVVPPDSGRRVPWRSHTYPKPAIRRELTRTNTLPHLSSSKIQNQKLHQEGQDRSHPAFPVRLLGLIRRLF